MTARSAHILPVIVLSQFAGTSLWFAGNAVLPDLQVQWGLPGEALGHLTTAVQLGFIAGTLIFALFAVSDRYSPRLVFATCSILGALGNAGAAVLDGQFSVLLGLRFATGFFLAGIYPVGMKIAFGWYQRELGKALGFLVGAVVLGTAFPHLVRALGQSLPWQAVIVAVSALAAAGGVLMFALVPDGPYLAKSENGFSPRSLVSAFRSRAFRASAVGYFGHMWELYAFWAFVPALLSAYVRETSALSLDVSFWSFAAIAVGGLACGAGGLASLRWGSPRIAFAQLLTSGLCCLISPLVFHAPPPLFFAYLLVWGAAVVGDSPQFSALNARFAPDQLVGSALTIVNCVGFGITIFSIQLLNIAAQWMSAAYLFLLLIPGPMIGLVALRPLLGSPSDGKGAPAAF